MSPWTETRRPMWPVYAGMVVIIVGLVAGYLLLTGVVGGGDGDESRDARTTDDILVPSATPQGPGGERRPALEVVSWGTASGQLAVVVRNESARHIERQRVRITARDDAGGVVLSTTGSPRDVCCTIVGLPPGQKYGLFAEVDPATTGIATVDVEPVATRTRGSAPVQHVAVNDPRLLRYDDDTVVTARLTARGRLSGYVSVQALLVDREGDVAQVISGRFYCFETGRSRDVRLHLFHAVPEELRLGRILAYPIPTGVPAHVPWECR